MIPQFRHRRHVEFRPSRTRRRRTRAGTAATELAVCLPMLTLIVFGSIQACNMIYLKHGLVTAAYEGTLELAKRNATNSSVIARTQQVLDARGVVSSSITLLPSGVNVSTATPGDAVTIQVSAQVSPNMSLTGFLPMPATLTGRIVATR